MKSRRLIGGVMLAAAPSSGSGVAAAVERQVLFTLSAGLHHVFDFWTVEDYARGVNDFPVTAAHLPFLAGIAFGRVSGRWLFEAEAHWTAAMFGARIAPRGVQAALSMTLVI